MRPFPLCLRFTRTDGGSVWYSKGHHDQARFRAALTDEDHMLVVGLPEIRRTYWRHVPGIGYLDADPGPGAFPVTYWEQTVDPRDTFWSEAPGGR